MTRVKGTVQVQSGRVPFIPNLDLVVPSFEEFILQRLTFWMFDVPLKIAVKYVFFRGLLYLPHSNW